MTKIYAWLAVMFFCGLLLITTGCIARGIDGHIVLEVRPAEQRTSDLYQGCVAGLYVQDATTLGNTYAKNRRTYIQRYCANLVEIIKQREQKQNVETYH